MMRLVLGFVLLFSTLSAASHLISQNDIETLFTKLVLNQLSDNDKSVLADVLEIVRRREPVSSKTLENSSQTRLSIDCIVCRSAFAALFQGVLSGQTDDQVSDTITTLCVSLGIENYNICSGAVSLNIPIFSHIIRTTPEATPNAFCNLILQNAGNPDVCPYRDPRFEWQVELPEKTDPIPGAINDGRPLKVAIITDAHIDPLYEAYGVADCDEPTCCRKGQTHSRSFTSESNINETLLEESLVKNDQEIMLDLNVANKIREQKKLSRTRFQNTRNSQPAGYWGDYRNCDTPLWAYDDAIETIKENHNDVDVIYYIGDTIDHGVWETSYELINNMNRYMIDKIKKTFGDDVMVVATLGNHEAQPTNQFAPSSVTGPKLNTTWLYESIVEKWGQYLSEEAKTTLLDRGDFAVQLRPGLKVISLNNNVAYRDNWWLVYDPLDAKRHLDWLVDELYKAEQNGEKVHILAHIPPGVADLTYTWTREYNRIVNRFSATIAAEFNGHTHSDEFKIFYSQDNTPINVAWGGGGITTYSHYNLNYKIVDIDGVSFTPNNIRNYAYNLTQANLTPSRRPNWMLLYDMRQDYRLTDLSPESMSNLVYSMVTTRPISLFLYAAYYSKVSDTRWPNCNSNCKIDNLCKTVVTVLWERERCNELRDLFYSAK